MKTRAKEVLISVASLAVTAALLIAAVLTNCFGLFGKEDPVEKLPGNAEISRVDGITVKSIERKDFVNYGLSERSTDSAYELTATIQPATLTNKALDWSIAFVDAENTWAKGKKLSDYVTLTPESDGALKAVVVCKQAFGAQIKVTAVSRANSKAKAECLVDYQKKVEQLAFYVYASDGFGTMASGSNVFSSVTTPGLYSAQNELDLRSLQFYFNLAYYANIYSQVYSEDQSFAYASCYLKFNEEVWNSFTQYLADEYSLNYTFNFLSFNTSASESGSWNFSTSTVKIFEQVYANNYSIRGVDLDNEIFEYLVEFLQVEEEEGRNTPLFYFETALYSSDYLRTYAYRVDFNLNYISNTVSLNFNKNEVKF